MVVNKLVHHLDTLVHFPACTLLGNYEVSKIGNSWKLIHFEMCWKFFPTFAGNLLLKIDHETVEHRRVADEIMYTNSTWPQV